MKLPENVLPDGSWMSVVLVQVTLIALAGWLAWLAFRHARPALRGAILLATLVGLLLAPAVAAVAPVWLPLPEWLNLADLQSPPAEPAETVAAPMTIPQTTPSLFALVVAQPPARDPIEPQDPTKQDGDMNESPVKAEAVVLNLDSPTEEAVPAPRPSNTPHASPPLPKMLAALWVVGAALFLVRALARLALLYRCAMRSRPVRESEWSDCIASLAKEHGLSAVALRESWEIASPLTMGLLRTVILLPRSRRNWSAQQRRLILGHELAHVRRRDFLAGLAAELAACLCWFHPLVRWLAGRLRLEQEYAADAWVAAADPTDYVRCLARLALELDGGMRRPLAPAFWRRRPEILRRIEMLRRNSKGVSIQLGKRAGWTVVVLAAAACLLTATVGPLHSAGGPDASKSVPEAKDKSAADRQGDALPEGALARLGTTRLRHGADVTFVGFGPGGKTLLTAGQDNTIRLWDRATGKEIRRFPLPKPEEPKKPQKGDKAKEEKAKAEQAQAIMALMGGGRNGGNVPRVAVTADGKTLAVNRGNVVELYNVETGKSLRRILAPAGGLTGLLFAPDGRTMAGRSQNGTLFVWATESGKEIRQIKPPARPQNNNAVFFIGGGGSEAPGMAFTPDGKILAAAAFDYKKQMRINSVKLWNLTTGEEIRRMASPGNVSVVAVASNGELAAFAVGNRIHLCEVKTGKELRQFEASRSRIVSLAFSADGKTLAVRGRNQQLGLWESQTGKQLHKLSEAQPNQRGGGAGAFVLVADGFPGFGSPEVRALALSPDGKQLVSAAGSSVRLWDVADGKEVTLTEGHQRAPMMLSVSRDGKTVVSWGADRVIRRWEAATGKPLGSFPAPAGTIRAALSSDGRTIALANADNTIRLHDTDTGKERQRFQGHANGTAALAFAPDGKLLASRGSGDSSIRFYELTGDKEPRQIALRQVRQQNQGFVIVFGDGGGNAASGPGMAFSPDGRLLVTPGPGRNNKRTLVILDVATGKELRTIELPQPITSLALSPDGRTLATENADRTITLWEVASGKAQGRMGKPITEQAQGPQWRMGATLAIDGLDVGDFSEPAGPVGLSFSPDGRALAVRGVNRSVRIWDVAADKEIGELKGHGGRVETVAFAADGTTLATGATDTTILLWNAAGSLKGVAKTQPIELPAADLDAIWSDLAGEDAAKALQGTRKLTAASRQAVPFLADHLKPAARIDPQKVKRWIGELDSEKFAVRQAATNSLVKGGEQVVPALKEALAASPQLETRKRIEELLNRLTGGTLTTEQLRLIRAVEALERMGTPEARRVLQTLAQGAPGTLPTREAEAALKRKKDNR